MIDILLDVHTHTIVSGHAFCTLNEMIAEAQRHHLTIFGVSEHGPAIPGTCPPIYFRNQHVVPRQYGDMTLLMGAELNIIDYEGNLDITDTETLSSMDHIIAGLHNAGITLRFCIIAPIIPLYLIIKRLSFQLLAWVNRERSFNFLFGINIVCIAFSIFLILCYILIAGIIVPHTSPEVAKTCIIFSFASGLMLFIVRGYKLIISRGFSHSFWFLYLCTLEFLPFVLAIEVLTI